MLVLTAKDRSRRWNELNGPDIERLIKKANKEGKGGRSAYALVKRFGIEGDFDFSANEWGEERSRNE